MTPSDAKRREQSVLNRAEVKSLLSVLGVRERLIVRLAIFAGIRPGEIFGLKWRHVSEQAATIAQRVYRGKLGTPKTLRSVRTAAFTPSILPTLSNGDSSPRAPIRMLGSSRQSGLLRLSCGTTGGAGMWSPSSSRLALPGRRSR
jgi:integrase